MFLALFCKGQPRLLIDCILKPLYSPRMEELEDPSFPNRYYENLETLRRIINGGPDKTPNMIADLNKIKQYYEQSTKEDPDFLDVTGENIRYTYRKIIGKPCNNLRICEVIIALLLKACGKIVAQSKLSEEENEHLKDFYDNKIFYSDDTFKNITEVEESLEIESEDEKNSRAESPNATFRIFAQEYFDQIKYKGRFKHYGIDVNEESDSYIEGITVTLKTSNDDAIDFENVIFPKGVDPDECRSSISLCGKGGIGKSFLILHLIKEIFDNPGARFTNIIPLYIELQKVNNEYGGDVWKALYEELRTYSYSASSLTEQEFDAYMHSAENKVIVFADGMNEVVGLEKRSAIATSITKIAGRHHCRFCISSRENHVGMFNRLAGLSGHFEDAKVNKLTETQIKDYLEIHGCAAQYTEIPEETRKLLETPQGLAMYVTLVGRDKSKVESFTSLGTLIRAFSDRMLGIEEKKKSPRFDLSFEESLEEIAYSWVKDSAFEGQITEDQREKLFKNEDIDVNVIFPCKDDEQTEDSIYEFSHQNFRDCYCARFIAHKIRKIDADHIDEIFDEYFNLSKSNVTDNLEILELVSAFVCSGRKEYDKQAIDVLREATHRQENPLVNYDYPLSRLIKIFAFRSNNCIARLDLSGLDLREVSLSTYALFDKRTGETTRFSLFVKRTGDTTKIYHTLINSNTFLKTGLDTASSTIAKFTYKDKEYVVAFAATSILVIDVQEAQARVLRNLYSNGWVSCCCSTYKNGVPVIYLGQRNGTVSEFYPHILFMQDDGSECFVKQRYAKQDINTPNDNAVESIHDIVLGTDEYIVFSSVGGRLCALKKYQTGTDKFIAVDLVEETTIDDLGLTHTVKQDTAAACRMTYSKKFNVLLAAYHKAIYLIDCKTNAGNITPKSILIANHNKAFDFDTDIEDIYACGKYVFINLEYKIAVFEIICDPDIMLRFKTYIYPAGAENEGVQYTKFSEIPVEKGASCTLVGVKAEDNRGGDKSSSLHSLKRFYQLYYSEYEDVDKLTKSIGNDYDGFPTWTGVFYQFAGKTFLASVSDGRTVEVDCEGEEEFPKRIYPGAYNGVHYIDIMNMDSEGATIICGNYDGMVLCIKYNCNRTESRWFVDNVFTLHRDWVWKCISLDSSHFISCGYDGKLWLVDTSSNSKELLINKEGEKLYDFCFDNDNNNIWLVSEHKLFLVQKTDSGWKKGAVCDLASIESYYCFRTIAIDNVGDSEAKTDNMPVLFYNEGKGKQGHIAKVIFDTECSQYRLKADFIDLTDSAFSEEVEENGEKKTNCLFIRHMRFQEFHGSKCLIAVGNIGSSGTLLVAKYNDNANEDASRMKVVYHRKIGKQINDFTVTFNNGEYIIWLAHKDRKVCALRVSMDDSDFKIVRLEDKTDEIDTGETCHVVMSDQPMCLRRYNDDVLIGLLNGDIMQASLSIDKAKNSVMKGMLITKKVIRTYADLISCPSVKLRQCICDEKEELKSQLQGYFTVEEE